MGSCSWSAKQLQGCSHWMLRLPSVCCGLIQQQLSTMWPFIPFLSPQWNGRENWGGETKNTKAELTSWDKTYLLRKKMKKETSVMTIVFTEELTNNTICSPPTVWSPAMATGCKTPPANSTIFLAFHVMPYGMNYPSAVLVVSLQSWLCPSRLLVPSQPLAGRIV